MSKVETNSDVLRVYADAVDKDRGYVTGLTIAMRLAAAERDALAARVETLTADLAEYRHAANAEAQLFDECRAALLAEKDAHGAAEARVEALENVTEFMWTVVCNVSEGDWDRQRPEWQEAAARVRDQWHAYLASRPAGEETQG